MSIVQLWSLDMIVSDEKLYFLSNEHIDSLPTHLKENILYKTLWRGIGTSQLYIHVLSKVKPDIYTMFLHNLTEEDITFLKLLGIDLVKSAIEKVTYSEKEDVIYVTFLPVY